MFVMLIIVYEQLESLDKIYDVLKSGSISVVVDQGHPLVVTDSGACTGTSCVYF